MRHALTILVLAAVVCVAGQSAMAQNAAAPATDKAAKGTDFVQGKPEQGPVTTPDPALPRQARWARVEISYRSGDIRHPALYCNSFQEKVRPDDDASANNILGWAAAMLYEYAQFPVQLILTPVLVAQKPPWTMERYQP